MPTNVADDLVWYAQCTKFLKWLVWNWEIETRIRHYKQFKLGQIQGLKIIWGRKGNREAHTKMSFVYLLGFSRNTLSVEIRRVWRETREWVSSRYFLPATNLLGQTHVSAQALVRIILSLYATISDFNVRFTLNRKNGWNRLNPPNHQKVWLIRITKAETKINSTLTSQFSVESAQISFTRSHFTVEPLSLTSCYWNLLLLKEKMVQEHDFLSYARKSIKYKNRLGVRNSSSKGTAASRVMGTQQLPREIKICAQALAHR